MRLRPNFHKTSGFILGVFLFLCSVFPLLSQEALPHSSSSKIPSSYSKEGCYTFVSYNIKNYLKMMRYVEGKRIMADKPTNETDQLIKVIIETNPDILGISEIGTIDDLKNLQSKLKQAGVNFPHQYHTGGSDQVRHQAILSRFPIISNVKPNIEFHMNGEKHRVNRGIVDAYVATPTGKVRLLGVHFKSKREIEKYSQETIRRNEAYTLRKHINDIHSSPETADDKVIVFGDFNDTINSVTLKTVIGSTRTLGYCRAIPLFDQYGLNWTHHWKWQDVYSRFDFVLANKRMMPFIIEEKSYVFDTTKYPMASDHRPIVVKFKPTK